MKIKTRLDLKKMLLLLTVILCAIGQLSAQKAVKVSVPFNVGYIGTEGNNPQDNLNVKSLTTLGIQRVSFGQTTTTGEFQLQGNDILGQLEFLLNDGTVKSINASLTWRVTTGNKIEAFGFIPVHGESFTYTFNSVERQIFGAETGGSDVLLVALNSTFRWNDGDNVNGNAATSGLLDALNDYLLYTQQNAPKGPLVVTTDTICSVNTAPKINGTVTMVAGESLAVYFNNKVYTPTLSGSNWSVAMPLPISTGAVEVTAEIINALGTVLTVLDTINVVNCALPNVAPDAKDDTASGPMNANVTGNVLTNDVDSDGGTLSVTKFTIGGTDYSAGTQATIAGKGKLTINANGTFTFIPEPNYDGTIPTVTYTISDGQGGTDTANLNITLTNSKPVVDNEIKTTNENQPVSGDLTDAGDSDAECPELTANTTPDVIPKHGTIVITSDGKYTYTPATGFSGKDTVVVSICDCGVPATCVNDTIFLTVSNVNVAPDAKDDTASGPMNANVTGNVLTNDVDSDGGTLSVTKFTINGVDYTAETEATIPNVGEITVNANGTYTFTPLANYAGSVPVVTYTISDGQGGTDTATLTITLTNSSPVVDNEIISTKENEPVSGDLTDAGDTDAECAELTVNTAPVVAPKHGTIVIAADGKYTYTPAADYSGNDTVVVSICDCGVPAICVNDTIFLTISDENAVPVANDDNAFTQINTPVKGNVLANDTDADNNPLVVTTFNVGGTDYPAGSTVNIPGKGILTLKADGTFNFVPATDFVGEVPAVTYTVSDGQGGTDTAKLTITVFDPANVNAPVKDDVKETLPNTPVSGNLLTNDQIVNGRIDSIQINGQNYPVGQEITLPNVGKIIVNADGTFTFTPLAGFTGAVPAITYFASDDKGNFYSAELEIVVKTNNPIARDDKASASKNSTVIGNVLANDTDSDGGVLTVTKYTINGVDYPAGTQAVIAGKGKLTILSNGGFVFTPEQDYVGAVPTAKYTVSDGQGGNATANLNITVYDDASPTAPVQDDVNEVQPGATATGKVFENDQIPGAVVDSIQIDGKYYPVGAPVSIPEVGTVQVNANGDYTFSPLPGFFGTVPAITYLATDNTGEFHSADLVIKVRNADPLAVNDEFTLNEGDVLSDNILNNDTDPNGSDLSVTGFTIAGQNYPVNTPAVIEGVGEITINADGTFEFVPVNMFGGNFPTITYTVSDGNGGVASAQINVTYVPAELFIPDGFSPNGYGINDKFVIRGLSAYPNNELRILNRWGNIVFEAKNYANDWDGTANTGVIAGGGELPVATYFYVLNLGNNNIKTGYIYLSR